MRKRDMWDVKWSRRRGLEITVNKAQRHKARKNKTIGNAKGIAETGPITSSTYDG